MVDRKNKTKNKLKILCVNGIIIRDIQIKNGKQRPRGGVLFY